MKKFKAWLLKTFFQSEIASAQEYLGCVCKQIETDNEQDERDFGIALGVRFVLDTFSVEYRR